MGVPATEGARRVMPRSSAHYTGPRLSGLTVMITGFQGANHPANLDRTPAQFDDTDRRLIELHDLPLAPQNLR